MTTKFIDKNIKRKVVKKTVFTKRLNTFEKIVSAIDTPEDFKYVQFLFTDYQGRSFFKCWDIISDDDGDASLYIGERGTEFDEQ